MAERDGVAVPHAEDGVSFQEDLVLGWVAEWAERGQLFFLILVKVTNVNGLRQKLFIYKLKDQVGIGNPSIRDLVFIIEVSLPVEAAPITRVVSVQPEHGFTGLGGRLQMEWVAAFTGIRIWAQ